MMGFSKMEDDNKSCLVFAEVWEMFKQLRRSPNSHTSVRIMNFHFTSSNEFLLMAESLVLQPSLDFTRKTRFVAHHPQNGMHSQLNLKETVTRNAFN